MGQPGPWHRCAGSSTGNFGWWRPGSVVLGCWYSSKMCCCAAVSSLAPGPSSTLSAGSAALRVAGCFVHDSNQKASDSRMKGLSLRIQTFFRGNLSQPQCFLGGKGNLAPLRILLKHLNVSLGLLWEKLRRSFVPLAVGTFVAVRCAYDVGINGNSGNFGKCRR